METIPVKGSRVVRGRDWCWSNQDGGEGGVGTVVENGLEQEFGDGIVVVLWDNGYVSNYRAGYQNCYDLLVVDSGPIGILHEHNLCTHCASLMWGMRWVCSECFKYNLCPSCYMSDIHDTSHKFLRFDHPSVTKGVEVPQRDQSLKLVAKGISTDAKVTRGLHWIWDGQDGGEESVGTVLTIGDWEDESGRSVARVVWGNGVTNVYRVGHKGKVDLKLKTLAREQSYYYVDHLPKCSSNKSEIRVSDKFVIGQKVVILINILEFKALQQNISSWSPRMDQIISKIGQVEGFTDCGSVKVKYNQHQPFFIIHPKALSKVKIFNVLNDLQKVRSLQQNLGKWNMDMEEVIGKTVFVLANFPNGTVKVKFENHYWILDARCLQSLSASSINNNRDFSTCPNTNQNTYELSQPQQMNIYSSVSSNKSDTTISSTTIEIGPSMQHDLLRYAHERGHEAMAQALQNVSNPNVSRDNSDLLLHEAAKNNQPEILGNLLQSGYEIDAKDDTLATPLHVAVGCKSVECVSMLVQNDCNVNCQDIDGDSPLHVAARKDDGEILDILLSNSAINPTITNNNKFNALHYAALIGNDIAAKRILRKRPEMVNLAKQDGLTALHLSCLNGHLDVVKILIEKGKALIDSRTKKNQTPLHFAIMKGYAGIVEFLVNMGADLNAHTSDGHGCVEVSMCESQSLTQLEDAREISEIFCKLPNSLVDQYPHLPLAGFLAKSGAQFKDKKLDQHILRELENLTVTAEKECQMYCGSTACVTFKPCSHKVLCISCSRNSKKCFVCKTVIREKIGPDGQPIEISDSELCAICMETSKSIVFQCGHMACKGCSDSLNVCPMCQCPITNKITIYT